MEYKNTLEGLKNVYERATRLGDDVMTLVDMEKNPVVKELITSLANQCYSLSIEAKDNAETYRDFMEEETDKMMDNFDEISDEDKEMTPEDEMSEEDEFQDLDIDEELEPADEETEEQESEEENEEV